tara:strand:- start:3946 stop:4143 length:198 start_codon:yes stop_codon:yes gene_type:complete
MDRFNENFLYKMNRADIVREYVDLMGSDAEERGFYRELASLTDAEIVSKIIEVAHYYKDEYNNME